MALDLLFGAGPKGCAVERDDDGSVSVAYPCAYGLWCGIQPVRAGIDFGRLGAQARPDSICFSTAAGTGGTSWWRSDSYYLY